jgi:predicted GNAT superfamily acetyltransferase
VLQRVAASRCTGYAVTELPVRLENGITVDHIRSPEEFREWQMVEDAVWSGEVMPPPLAITMQRYGGLLLGVREPGGTMIAILLGFMGRRREKLVHCSHQLGILPGWRNQDLGYTIKCLQRRLVIDQGLDTIVWTFDPLETRNARLNLARLGGVASDYTRNIYGPMLDGLNKGLESDRLTISWYVTHLSVEARLAGTTPLPDLAGLRAEGVPVVTHTAGVTAPDGTHYRRLTDVTTGAAAALVLVEAPANFQAIKPLDPEAARTWRHGTRAVFEDFLARGYAALYLVRDESAGGPPRCYYLLGSLESYLSGQLPW